MVDGRPVIDAAALAETHRPQVISRQPRDPATDRAGFYGLGWGVSYDDQVRVLLGHTGGFNLGDSTAVYLLPGENVGIVVLTNGSPVGVPETVALSFLDLVRFGQVQQDYLAVLRPAIEAQNGPSYGRRSTTPRRRRAGAGLARPGCLMWGPTPMTSSATFAPWPPTAGWCSS